MATRDEIVNERIGKTIARKRKVAGYTQEEVAAHLGIGAEAYSRIERGLVSPGLTKLYDLAELFECAVEGFLIESSRRPTDQGEYIVQMLATVSTADRIFVVRMMEKLIERLSKDTPKTRKGRA